MTYNGRTKKIASQATPGSAIPAQNPWCRPFGGLPLATCDELRPGVLPQRLSSRGQLQRLIALEEVLLADDRGLQVRRDDVVLDELVRVDGDEGRLVTDEI